MISSIFFSFFTPFFWGPSKVFIVICPFSSLASPPFQMVEDRFLLRFLILGLLSFLFLNVALSNASRYEPNDEGTFIQVIPNFPIPAANKTRPSEYPIDTAKVRVIVYNTSEVRDQPHLRFNLMRSSFFHGDDDQ